MSTLLTGEHRAWIGHKEPPLHVEVSRTDPHRGKPRRLPALAALSPTDFAVVQFQRHCANWDGRMGLVSITRRWVALAAFARWNLRIAPGRPHDRAAVDPQNVRKSALSKASSEFSDVPVASVSKREVFTHARGERTVDLLQRNFPLRLEADLRWHSHLRHSSPVVPPFLSEVEAQSDAPASGFTRQVKTCLLYTSPSPRD